MPEQSSAEQFRSIYEAQVKRISLQVLRQAEVPIDFARIEWWEVTPSGVRAHRATYHVDLPWEEHPWSLLWPDGRRGAPFKHDWAIEKEEKEWGTSRSFWSGEGRWENWSAPLKWLDRPHAGITNTPYLSYEAAVEAFQDYLLAKVRHARQALDEAIADAKRHGIGVSA